MKRKIKTTNYDGTIIEVEVNINVYNYDKENYWQENWRNRKSKHESSFEEMYSYYEKGELPLESQEESPELTYIRNYEYEELHKAIGQLSQKQQERIKMYYFYGLKIEDIANIQKVKKHAISMSLDNASKKLKKLLKKSELF